MNSTEIEEIVHAVKERLCIVPTGSSEPLSLNELHVLFVGEIALQLASLYEHFQAVDEHVFGDKKRG